VAYEMARQLTAQGQPIATLVVLDAAAPSPPPEPGPALRRLAREAAELPLFRDALGHLSSDDAVHDVAILLGYLGAMAPGIASSPRRLRAQLSALSPDDQRVHALKLFGLDRVYHRESSPERLARLWKVLCINLLAALKYRPQPYSGHLALFRAASNPDPDPARGWTKLAGTVTIHTIPGDHATMLQPPGVEVLAGVLISEFAEHDAHSPWPDPR
jgi:thioesterase domain-containing protein